MIDPGINIPRGECVFGIVCGASELARLDGHGDFDEIEVTWRKLGRKVHSTKFFGFGGEGEEECRWT